MRDIQAIEILR